MSYPIEILAERLYGAWCQYEIETCNIAHPRWFAVVEEIKVYWRGVAEETLRRESEREWADRVADPTDSLE